MRVKVFIVARQSKNSFQDWVCITGAEIKGVSAFSVNADAYKVVHHLFDNVEFGDQAPRVEWSVAMNVLAKKEITVGEDMLATAQKTIYRLHKRLWSQRNRSRRLAKENALLQETVLVLNQQIAVLTGMVDQAVERLGEEEFDCSLPAINRRLHEEDARMIGPRKFCPHGIQMSAASMCRQCNPNGVGLPHELPPKLPGEQRTAPHEEDAAQGDKLAVFYDGRITGDPETDTHLPMANPKPITFREFL